MLAEENTVVAMAMSTSGRRSTENSWRSPAEGRVATLGTSTATGTSAMTPSPVIAQNVARQP